jgi:ribonucleoside-diphosphate reductase alpha chain
VDESLVGQPKGHANGHPVGREHRTNGNAAPAAETAPAAPAPAAAAPANRSRLESYAAETGPDSQLSHFPGDAPLCDNCGHITIRNGTCYKCLNCGTSLGCS